MTALEDALFAEYAREVWAAAMRVLPKALFALGGTGPRYPFWERLGDLRGVLDAGRVYFTPAEFLARFRTTPVDGFEILDRSAVLAFVAAAVELAGVDDREGPAGAALVARMTALLPGVVADAWRGAEDDGD
ncbi:hypothetical protein [Limnoglobus roseus]|uniref:Uncharacterized protein n=1 Tax=Limnoglobus roseus TaxID=2598579 RepID=A0A5C1AK62_9BACT|nr:hypothetical protein [Limnoglobus roseus]QEL17534.1 hypothetical protein PX52LOC_04524 [Limnoglobus roseus]